MTFIITIAKIDYVIIKSVEVEFRNSIIGMRYLLYNGVFRGKSKNTRIFSNILKCFKLLLYCASLFWRFWHLI